MLQLPQGCSILALETGRLAPHTSQCKQEMPIADALCWIPTLDEVARSTERPSGGLPHMTCQPHGMPTIKRSNTCSEHCHQILP